MSRPIRLLMTVDAVGGVWQYATDLAAALLPLGVEATLALIGPPPSADQRAGLPAGVPLIETGLPIDWLADGPEAVVAAARAVAALAAGFDLAQLNMPSLAAAAYSVPTIAVAHGCLATWWEAAHGGPPPADMAWQVAATRAGLHAADMVVAPTRAFAASVQRHYALPSEPVAIHNGRRPIAAAGEHAPGARAFTAGRLWDRVKNVDTLDAAAARSAVPFEAAGAVRAPHGETVAPRHLRLLGTLVEADLASRLAARPIFVTAARFEPFGFAVLEAAQAGCPLVLSDIASFRELWDGAARFVDADDPAAFARAIEALAADEEARWALGDAARERARRYTPAATADAMQVLYARLLTHGRRAAA